MDSYRVVSSDDHVFEPVDLWTSRIEPRFRDRAPHVGRYEDGQWWVCDGVRAVGLGSGAQAGVRFEDHRKLTFADEIENLRPGGWIPEEHVKDMDIDGVDVSIVYPTAAMSLYSVPDTDLLSAIFKAYNDWVAEFCQADSRRLKGIALLNTDDVGVAVAELERCAKLGYVGANISVYPPEERSYDLPEYEPLWAASADLEIPLSLHIGTNRPGPGQEFQDTGTMKPAFLCNVDHWVRVSLGHMIYSGVFERHPKLQVVAVEHELSWAPHFIDRLDFCYSQRQYDLMPYRYKEDMLPSDYFRRNVFLSFQEDSLGVQLRGIIGVDNLLWGADYPHPESTFPRSREILEDILADCTDGEKAKIAGRNAARVYRLN